MQYRNGDEVPAISLRGLGAALRRQAVWILVTTLLGVGLTTYVVLRQRPVYEARATLRMPEQQNAQRHRRARGALGSVHGRNRDGDPAQPQRRRGRGGLARPARLDRRTARRAARFPVRLAAYRARRPVGDVRDPARLDRVLGDESQRTDVRLTLRHAARRGRAPGRTAAALPRPIGSRGDHAGRSADRRRGGSGARRAARHPAAGQRRDRGARLPEHRSGARGGSGERRGAVLHRPAQPDTEADLQQGGRVPGDAGADDGRHAGPGRAVAGAVPPREGPHRPRGAGERPGAPPRRPAGAERGAGSATQRAVGPAGALAATGGERRRLDLARVVAGAGLEPGDLDDRGAAHHARSDADRAPDPAHGDRRRRGARDQPDRDVARSTQVHGLCHAHHARPAGQCPRGHDQPVGRPARRGPRGAAPVRAPAPPGRAQYQPVLPAADEAPGIAHLRGVGDRERGDRGLRHGAQHPAGRPAAVQPAVRRRAVVPVRRPRGPGARERRHAGAQPRGAGAAHRAAAARLDPAHHAAQRRPQGPGAPDRGAPRAAPRPQEPRLRGVPRAAHQRGVRGQRHEGSRSRRSWSRAPSRWTARRRRR